MTKKKYKLNIKYIDYSDLVFNFSIPEINFKTDLPIIVTDKNFVVVGNCLRFNLNDKVKCIVVEHSDYLLNTFIPFEKEVVEEAEFDRYYEIEKEMKTFLSEFEKDYEVLSLFDDEELEEKRLITVENFIAPPPYNFEKTEWGANDDDDEQEGFL